MLSPGNLPQPDVFYSKLIQQVAAIGGEFIGVDTTMVLVAGTHSVAAWMIPVIISGIGFAIVIARKF